MTDEKKAANQYRFSGFQLYKIQLDATGPAYVEAVPHPYFYNQPAYWAEPYFQMKAGPSAVQNEKSKTTKNQLYKMLITFK